jgi:hypothetical protein
VSPKHQPSPDQNKNILEELVKQMKRNESESKDNNEVFLKAIVDKLGAKKDDGLKSEISVLRNQLDMMRRNSTVSDVQSISPALENELKGKIR